MKKFTKKRWRLLAVILAAVLVMGMMPTSVTRAAGDSLSGVESASANGNIVTVKFASGVGGRITFLEDGIFRYNVDPSGVFSEYAATVYGNTVFIVDVATPRQQVLFTITNHCEF